VVVTPKDEIKKIERGHWMLRENIAEAKQLCERARQLILKHRKKKMERQSD
jgi:hypothetical protein